MSVDITLRAVKGTPLLNSEVDTNFTNLKTAIDAYTAADVLIKIKTVDGSGSGLDADTVDSLNTSSTDTTGNSIVSRASGNFSAGTITATLVGNVTGNVTGTAGHVAYSGLTGITPTWNQNTTGLAAGLSTTLVPASGGTGATTLPLNSVLLGNLTNAVQSVSPGVSGNVLTSNGGSWVSASLPTMSGPTGPTGATGPSGATGPTGATGPSGAIYTIISGWSYTAGYTNSVGSWNDTENYFDVFPPSGKTMSNIVAFIASVKYIYYAGTVDANDQTRCTYTYLTDRIRVWVQNTEQRSTPAGNYLGIWS